MKFFVPILLCVVVLTSCKKTTDCPNLDGKWLLAEIWQDNLKTRIPDTSALSETLEINGNTFVSSSTKTGKIWNSGTFDCSKVFEADTVSFKKGSKAYFNLYVKR